MAKLIEYVQSPNVKVDRESGVIGGVKLLGLTSKNGRRYTESAVRNAASLYEGARCHIDHRDPHTSQSRSLSTRFGVIRGVNYRESEGLFGDLHYTKSHPMAEPIAEMAERFPESFGMSHDADGNVRRVGGETLVESIKAVNSVDVVDSPATTRGLHESEESMKTTLKKLIEATDYPYTAQLLEMLPEVVDAEAVIEDPPAENADPVEAVKQSLAAEAEKIFLDPSIDPTETGKKIKDLAKAAEDIAGKLNPAEAPADEEPGEEEEETESAPAVEALQKTVSTLTESLARFEKRDAARGLLESLNARPTEALIAELVECKDAKAMRAKADGWSPEKLGRVKPALGGLLESEDYKYPKDQKRVIAALKRR